MNVVHCRGRIVTGCLNTRPASEHFGEDLPLAEDGTFDGTSIVCDPCYIALMPLTPSGMALNHELAAAIRKVRG